MMSDNREGSDFISSAVLEKENIEYNRKIKNPVIILR